MVHIYDIYDATHTLGRHTAADIFQWALLLPHPRSK